MVVPALYSLTYTDLTWVYSSSFKPQDMSLEWSRECLAIYNRWTRH